STDVPATIPQSWPTGNGELVLVIDDQAAIREIVKETLEAHNYRVVLANDGAVGLLLYRDHPDDFDLVIIDVTNPALDGQATIASIRKLNPEARIDRKSTRLNSSHVKISYAVFCLKKKMVIACISRGL